MISQPISGGTRAMPRRSSLHVLIPIGVVVSLLAILAWSTWPLLHPARTIEIEQAIVTVSNETQPQPVALASSSEPVQSTRMVQAAGWLESQPYFTAAPALTDGIIDEMLILEGDRVEAGQPLARMVDQDAVLMLNRAIASHQSAQAALILALAKKTSAEQNWDTPYELERDVANALAQLEGLKAQLAQLPSLIRT